MIIELTKENLQKCGFDEEQIIKLLEWDKYDMFFFKDTCYYATNIEKKIFTEIDGFRKYYLENGIISFPMNCPDLIPNYFDLALKNYLDKQILLLNTMFVETDQKKKFILNEIEKIKSSIEVLKEDIKIKIYFIRDNKKKQVDILDSYLNFLKNKLDGQPQRNEASKPKKLKKTLLEFIHNVENKEAFIQDLKNTFPTEIGKSIKAIIDLLKKDEYLIHNDREFSDVVNAIKIFFNRDIGSVQSIRDAKNTDDKIFIEPIELKLNPLIIKYKSK